LKKSVKPSGRGPKTGGYINIEEDTMKMVVITGCDTGIGKSLAGIFLEKGYHVIISYLDENPFKGKDRVEAQKLDLRSSDEIESFARFTREFSDKGFTLDYMVNNAGIALGGPFENVPMDIFRQVWEVNFFGLISLTQKILPSLLKHRGRLVINGSLAGKVALPFLSPYTSAKFALEGFCDSVRRELNPLGIRTILLEPGGIATPIWNKAKEQDSSFIDLKYEKSMRVFTENFIEGGNRGMETEKAARQIYRVISKRNPRPRYIIAKNRLISYLETLLPDRLLDRLVVRLFSMDYGSG
jgi:NAD(P)-dependent dehydrogenase (short-subunit alcohol dehydrogenase family)